MMQDIKYNRRASDLIGLLIDWVIYCDLLEDHNSRVIGKRYSSIKEETQAYKKLQEFTLQPLITKCAWARIRLTELREIIPPAFETTWKQRGEIIEDLITWSIKEFGEYVIPF